jgi:hypothetical protein
VAELFNFNFCRKASCGVNFAFFVVNMVYIMTEATLVDQPKGAELEYRVIAINKSGEGSPSNTVMVVL